MGPQTVRNLFHLRIDPLGNSIDLIEHLLDALGISRFFLMRSSDLPDDAEILTE